jgi:hypothetical protein
MQVFFPVFPGVFPEDFLSITVNYSHQTADADP